MNITKTISLVGGVTVVLGAITAIIVFWSAYGWITKMAYASDHESVPSQQTMKAILDSLETIKDTQDDIKLAQAENQDQWECDEMDEEIPALQGDLADAMTNGEKIKIQRKLDKQNERWVTLTCSRFTE